MASGLPARREHPGKLRDDEGANNGSNNIALFELAPGTLAWTKVVDTTQSINENCRALADNHIGHLILQCNTTMLRSK